MKPTGGYLYSDQKAAEERVGELRASLVSLVDHLEQLNESIDSLKLAHLIDDAKFRLGLL